MARAKEINILQPLKINTQVKVKIHTSLLAAAEQRFELIQTQLHLRIKVYKLIAAKMSFI